MLKICDGKDYIPEVRELIIEYTQRLGRDLGFQDLEEELRDPAKKYTPPEGELLVAIDTGEVLGMVAYHRHSDTRCEMKRLFVRPEGRGRRIGDRLVEEIMARAKEAGYEEMVLDTLIPLKPAIHLYEKYGFRKCDPYYYNPFPDVLFYSRKL